MNQPLGGCSQHNFLANFIVEVNSSTSSVDSSFSTDSSFEVSSVCTIGSSVLSDIGTNMNNASLDLLGDVHDQVSILDDLSVPGTSAVPVTVPSTSAVPVTVPGTNAVPVTVPSTSAVPVMNNGGAHNDGGETQRKRVRPEDFQVDGDNEENIDRPSAIRVNQSKENKVRRNLGLSYTSNSTMKSMPARNVKQKDRCKGHEDARSQHYLCRVFSPEDRQHFQDGFYSMGDLQKQREWIKRHVRVLAPKSMTGSHKHRTYAYHLPNPVRQQDDQVLVCKQMFLNTVGISERMVRTTLAKTMPVTGILAGELRGGRSEKMKLYMMPLCGKPLMITSADSHIWSLTTVDKVPPTSICHQN